MQKSYCTTGQFARRDAGTWHKHCGPTAITNLLCTLRPELAADPGAVFDEVARLGRRLGVYWNIAPGRWLGGTSDALAGVYLRRALARFAVPEQVRFGGVATPARLRAALAEGAIVYLQMHWHPTYRNHHLLLYGHDWQGYRAADGWQHRPVFLAERDLRGCTFFAITAR